MEAALDWGKTMNQYADIDDDLRGLLASLAQLKALKALPASWDGHGSPPIHPLCLAVAEGVLRALKRFHGPYVVPLSGGGVQLEWQIGTRFLYLDVVFLPDQGMPCVRYLFGVAAYPEGWQEGELHGLDMAQLLKKTWGVPCN